MKNRKKKGEYGYRSWHKRVRMAEVAVGAVMILFQLGARSMTDWDAAKNVLTVMAILSVLPVANVASPLIASWKYKTPSIEFYNKIKPYEEKTVILYDLIITSKEQIIPLDAIAIHPTGVYCFCSNGKLDTSKGEKYLNEMFAGHRLDPHVKILKEEKAYIRRLENLKDQTEYEDDGSVSYSESLLKNLSM